MDKNLLPKHIAIIPDGNRRWAKTKGRPSIEGHRYAAQTVLPNLIDELIRLKINCFTFWALSTENLTGRSKEELNNLFNLIRYFLKNKLREFKEKQIKLVAIGDLKGLPNDLQEEIFRATSDTKDNRNMTFVIALNYGGRDELVRSISKIKKQRSKITKEDIEQNLDTVGIPDPDLIIRTGGEKRLSGFMLWQSEYSELYFSDLYFPDFTAMELKKAISNYSERQRRFGK